MARDWNRDGWTNQDWAALCAGMRFADEVSVGFDPHQSADYTPDELTSALNDLEYALQLLKQVRKAYI